MWEQGRSLLALPNGVHSRSCSASDSCTIVSWWCRRQVLPEPLHVAKSACKFCCWGQMVHDGPFNSSSTAMVYSPDATCVGVCTHTPLCVTHSERLSESLGLLKADLCSLLVLAPYLAAAVSQFGDAPGRPWQDWLTLTYKACGGACHVVCTLMHAHMWQRNMPSTP
jgi:hypothetical protein